MNLEEKIKIQQKVIEELNQKKEFLEKKVDDLQFDLDFYKKSYNETLQKAKDMIAKCSDIERQYSEAIHGANMAKLEYEKARLQIYSLKNEYRDEFEKMLEKI